MNVRVDYHLIGCRIREHRRQAHLTQAELAERAGICQQFVGALERGIAIPSLTTILSLCHVLGLEPNALLLDAAQYDPEAPCSLHDLPSPLNHTLTSRLIGEHTDDSGAAADFDFSLLPAFDIVLDHQDTSP